MKVKNADKIIKYIKKHHRVMSIEYRRYDNTEYLYVEQDDSWSINIVNKIDVYLFNNNFLYKTCIHKYHPRDMYCGTTYIYKRCLNDN